VTNNFLLQFGQAIINVSIIYLFILSFILKKIKIRIEKEHTLNNFCHVNIQLINGEVEQEERMKGRVMELLLLLLLLLDLHFQPSFERANPKHHFNN